MPSKGTFYGVVAVMVALLIVVSSVAAVYYGKYQQQASQDQQYVSELNAALASYRTLAGSFNASLSDYNTTLYLLSDAVANLNTSTPAYTSGSVALASLWSSYQRLASVNGGRVLTYEVNLLVDYGNGTGRWYNDSAAEPGWNAYVLTLVLMDGEVQAAWYPQFGEHLVTGIERVSETATESWFVWDYGASGWALAPMGADAIIVQNGTSVAWTFCGYDANFNPTCAP
jgi:type II secretory pathway pseudopilin PulG